jgi:hypothetical protein
MEIGQASGMGTNVEASGRERKISGDDSGDKLDHRFDRI